MSCPKNESETAASLLNAMIAGSIYTSFLRIDTKNVPSEHKKGKAKKFSLPCLVNN
jgi:hypothetical protein